MLQACQHFARAGFVAYLILTMATMPAMCKVIYVSPDGSDANSGLTWSKAKRTIGAALLAAVGGDQVWVRYGVYYEHVTLKSGVGLYGGFRGTETSLSQRPPFPRAGNDPYESLIHGGWTTPAVVTTPNTASRPYRIDGFTISYGRDGVGGGIHCYNAGDLLTVANCTITRNTAEVGGGGVYIGGNSSPVFIQCVISDNEAREYGGGVYIDSSWPQLIGCTVRNNRAHNVGGGIHLQYGGPVLTNCFVIGNDANNGGGVSCRNSRAQLSGCVIADNTASRAAGVYCDGYSVVPPKLDDCLIARNRAMDMGGGVLCENCPAKLNRCEVRENSAVAGGGIACWYSSAMITNCNVTGNMATGEQGGGILLLYSPEPRISGCIITANIASTQGGGVSSIGGGPQLTSCVVSENRAGERGGGLYTHEAVARVMDCIFTGNSAGDGGGMFLQGKTLVGRCVFRVNTAGYDGGAVYSNGFNDFRYCVISNNKAGNNGGGILSYRSDMRIVNCTLIYNTAAVDGGALSCDRDGFIFNSIIAYNSSGVHYSAGEWREFYHNCVWANEQYNFNGVPDPTGWYGNISVDPMISGAHLIPGSPCINAGTSAVSVYDTDIDGELTAGDGLVDIGADEYYAPVIQGRLIFGDYNAVPPISFVEIRSSNPQTRMVIPDPDGGFTIGNVPSESFSISFKPSHFLRRTIGVDTSAGSVTGLEVYLVNGDIDGDNEVTLFDFGQLVAAFGSMPGDANWNPNADLDGDREVSLFDFGVLVRNFGGIGDD